MNQDSSTNAAPNPAHGAAQERVPFNSYLAIALVSCAVLLYEIAITRILSVVVWYHFAFLSLSLAMLGLGAPGVWFSLRPPGPRSLARALIAAGIAITASVAVIFRLGGLPIDRRVPVLVICVLAPMLALGAGICILLIQAGGRRIGRMYGADLLGGVVGAVLVMPLMYLIPTPYLLALAGFLPLAAAVLTSPRRPIVAVVAAVALAAGLMWGTPFELRYTKTYRERTEPEYEKWTPTARLTVWDRPIWSTDPNRPWMWGMGSRYQPRKLTQKWIEQDGSAGTPIENLSGSPEELDHLGFDVTGVGYQLRPPETACVIGAGGGRDILTALQVGASRVDAVELNGAIIDVVSGPFGEFSGDVYHLEGVRPIASEGRSYLMRTDEEYDLIQISLVDSWAATAAGAYALSENYLYTVEAFRLYFSRLTESGILSVSRWFGGSQQMESARLSVLALAALRAEGVDDPTSHVAIVGSSGIATLLVGRRPFAEDEIDRLDRICLERGFARMWPPGPFVPASTITTVMTGGVERHRAAGFDLSPPVDDRPFFFQTVSLLRRLEPEFRDVVGPNERAVSILRQVTVALLLITLGLFFVPLLLAGRFVRGPRFWRGSAYFACIGIGFMFAEVPWIQRFILYLGHPSLATTAVISALLLGAGIGAMIAPRFADAPLRRIGLTLPVALGLLNLSLQPLLEATLGWNLALRLASTILALAPIGVLMGFAFPVGMIRFGDANKPWFWAVNGAFSVVGSALSVAVSMLFGFSTVLFLAVAAYLLALAFLTGR